MSPRTPLLRPDRFFAERELNGLRLLVVGLALHAGSWLMDGRNGVVESFPVALWGLVPSMFGVVVALVVIWLVYDPLTVTPQAGLSVLVEHTRRELQPLFRWRPGMSGLTTLWGAVIWRYGLVEERGLRGTEASLVAGVAAVLSWGLSLL